MGWTFFDKAPRGGLRAYITNELLTWESPTTSYRVLKDAMVGSVHYAAVEQIEKATGARSVFAAVTLTQGESGYKGMHENMGPCESACPASILRLLTPTESQWANEWRERCRDNARRVRLSDLAHALGS
jgi:hypothetical protein